MPSIQPSYDSGQSRRQYIQGGSAITRYRYGDRAPECVDAHREYHRIYQREYRKGQRRKVASSWRPDDEIPEPDEAGCLIANME